MSLADFPFVQLDAETRQGLRWQIDAARRRQADVDPARCYGLARENSWRVGEGRCRCHCVDCVALTTARRRERRHRQMATDPAGFRERDAEKRRRRRQRRQLAAAG